mmetsp:Transcript_12073/g.18126  ORF Transcript_12073/g.18126 Transcript_12073/m.18126 type:complete len:256 (-) Transcript_12073:1196-1963(-)
MGTGNDVLAAAHALPLAAASAELQHSSLVDDQSPPPQSSPTADAIPTFARQVSSAHANDQTLDQRDQHKLDSYNTYAIVASMVMGTSFSIVTMVDFTLLNATPAYVQECHPSDEQDCLMGMYRFVCQMLRMHCTDYLTYAVIVCSSLSLVSAVYAMMIFNFTVIYSKSAMGRSNCKGYKTFLEKTEKYRRRGFNTFWTSIELLMVSFTLWLLLMLKARIEGIIIVMFVGGLVHLAMSDFRTIAYTATEHIFSDQS